MIVSDKTMHTIASVCRIYQDCSLRALQLPPEQAQGQSIGVARAITEALYTFLATDQPGRGVMRPALSMIHTCVVRSVFKVF